MLRTLIQLKKHHHTKNLKSHHINAWSKSWIESKSIKWWRSIVILNFLIAKLTEEFNSKKSKVAKKNVFIQKELKSKCLKINISFLDYTNNAPVSFKMFDEFTEIRMIFQDSMNQNKFKSMIPANLKPANLKPLKVPMPKNTFIINGIPVIRTCLKKSNRKLWSIFQILQLKLVQKDQITLENTITFTGTLKKAEQVRNGKCSISWIQSYPTAKKLFCKKWGHDNRQTKLCQTTKEDTLCFKCHGKHAHTECDFLRNHTPKLLKQIQKLYNIIWQASQIPQ